MLAYFNYYLLFFKLWGLNKLLFGVPLYLVEHLIINGIVKITMRGGKYFIDGVGGYMFPSPISIVDDVGDDVGDPGEKTKNR